MGQVGSPASSFHVPPTMKVPLSASEGRREWFCGRVRDRNPARRTSQHDTLTVSSSTCGPPFVNRLHDLGGPPYRIRDCAKGRRHSLPAFEVRQLTRSEDTCSDQEHAFAALVHAESMEAYSPCVRCAAADFRWFKSSPRNQLQI